jgi:molybdopterin-guanine dinucleotide biosynthesis protein A
MRVCHDSFMHVPMTAAAIVAGGRARRYGGRDKSRLVVDGRTIIVRQVEALQPVAAEIVVVAPDAARFADLPVRVVADRQPGLGAVGGIDAALHAVDCDRVIVLACDLPFVTTALLATLAERADGHDGAWVRTGQGVEPLVACYRRQAREPLARYIAAGGRRARDLERWLDMAVLESPELDRFGPPARLLANINTPADYARIQYDSA